MAMRVGFIGLGLMGQPMALNVAKAKFPLAVCNRTPAKAEPLRTAGATVAKTPRAVAEEADVVVTMVSGPADVEEVVLGPEGVAAGAKSGSVLIDMSTVGPQDSQRIAAAIADRGMAMLDAPVSGGVMRAEQGTLTIMVGGPESVFGRCLPVLQVMGDKVIRAGEQGMGSLTKLVNNLISGGIVALIGEALLLGVKGGLDPKGMLEVLSTGTARSAMLETYGPLILQGDFAPRFPLKHMHKDFGLIVQTAQTFGVPLPTTALIHQIYGAARAAGKGELNFSAVMTLWEEIAGVKVRSRE
ncbi:MAG: NAD(P)-dependent oxidoreductase [Candidatus Methylomirabilales bacterium]